MNTNSEEMMCIYDALKIVYEQWSVKCVAQHGQRDLSGLIVAFQVIVFVTWPTT